MTSAITFFAQAWCVARRGPLFSALFQPLCTVIVTVLGYIFLHEDLYLGRYSYYNHNYKKKNNLI